MTGITHKQAGRYMRKALDGLLTADQRRDLQTHLDECATCRLESESFSLLTARLKTDFQARWDTQHGPSKNVMANVQSQTRRIIMKKRIDFAFNILGGAAALLVLFFVIASVISQFQKKSTATNGTQIAVSSPQGMERLLAFTSEKSGNFDIYTMHADGTGLINLTNNPAQDSNPIWSLDGKSIVFESDRTGISQIYIMNADGSDIIQITNDNAEHHLLLNGDDRLNLWSPDGSRLLFVQKDSGSRMNSLFSVDINGENKILLTSDTRDLNTVSWSPDGEFVGYVLWDEVQPDGFRPNIYVVDAAGNKSIELSKFLPSDERIFTPYFWSSDGRSLIFPANNYEDHNETIHQYDPQTNVLSQLATTKPMLSDWYDGVALSIDADKNNQPLLWRRPDGTSAELDIHKGADPVNCYIGRARSLHGNLVIGSYCRNDNKVSLYWTNVDGSKIEELPSLEVPVVNGGLIGLTLSPDETFVTFNFESDDETYLYIWNIEDALKDASVQPTKLLLGNSRLRYIPSWQPIVNNDIVEQKPTPEPIQTSAPTDLVAFMAETNLATNNNTDIYTMRMDGSGVTNLTHDPAKDFNANDYNPAWSPDKKKIAFISDRGGNSTGNTDIFVMNPDGSDQTRLTNNPGLDEFLAWSPDGKQIAYYSSPVDEFYATGQLIIMNSDGSNKTVITQEPGYYYFQGWSPDGQKIVYGNGKPRLVGDSFKDIGIHIVDIDGKNQHEWFVGNFDQLHWEDSEHFLGVVQTGTETQPQWTLYRFSADGSQREIATHSAPIAAFFENTYVTDGQGGQTWFTHASDPIPAIPWNSAEKCQATGDSFVSTSHVIAPDKKQAFVMIYCEAATRFYIENEDGSKIEPLSGSIDSSLGLFPQWSSDEKYVSINTFNYKDPFAETVVYLFDIEKMLKDPSTQAIQTTLNMTVSGQLVFGFPPGDNDKFQEPTPRPLTFSLTTQQAKLLANFTVLEPSYLPAGYILEGMDYDPYTQKIAMKYISQQSEGILFVYQRRGDFMHDPAMQAYVTPVSIGDMEAEYVQGAWIYDTPETTIPRWDPSATFYSLTWQKGEVVFSIEFIGGETVTPPSLADFIAIAESLK